MLFGALRLNTQEGILLLIRILLAQEETVGDLHFKRALFLGKSFADTVTSFLPPVA